MADPVVKKPVQINRLRLIQSSILGKGGDVLLHLGEGEQIGHRPFKMMFDTDPRFIRIESFECVDLIPLTNVCSIKIT